MTKLEDACKQSSVIQLNLRLKQAKLSPNTLEFISDCRVITGKFCWLTKPGILDVHVKERNKLFNFSACSLISVLV